MSSLTEIYFNYNQAIKQADKLEDVAQRLNNVACKNMDQVLNEINIAWKSDSSTGYIEKGNMVKEKIEITALDIRRIAVTIKAIAERILRAELEAWRIANERKG